MSNSFKRQKFYGICADSEKLDKRTYNRGYRSRLKTAIRKGQFDRLPIHRGNRHGGNWNFHKDGKVRLTKDKMKREEIPYWWFNK